MSGSCPVVPGLKHALPRSIHRYMEHIWERFHLRARLFLLENGELILCDCVGEYRFCPEIGLKVHPDSLIWEIFKKGEAVNFKELPHGAERPHTLPEPVKIKAIFPLKGFEFLEEERSFAGALVVDAGDSGPIEDRDFAYLELVAMLISEVLESFILINKIKEVQVEKEKMASQVFHIFRNRFTVIGGFAKKIAKGTRDQQLKKWAGIVQEEVRKGQEALETWRKFHRERGMYYE